MALNLPHVHRKKINGTFPSMDKFHFYVKMLEKFQYSTSVQGDTRRFTANIINLETKNSL